MSSFSFTAPLVHNTNHLYAYQYYVPNDIVVTLKKEKIKRLSISINGNKAFDSGLIPGGDQQYFIKVNQAQRKKMKLVEGEDAEIILVPNTSEYGMPLPEEFAEIWQIDDEAYKYFHELTPGKQRNLIYIINKIKNLNLRAERSYIIMDHLKINQGNLDFRILLDSFKK